MSDVTTENPSAPNDGAATTAGAPAAPATEAPSTVTAASAKMREAFGVLKQHPLGAVATVAAATALIEVELAVGILAGLGATAMLATRSGPEARQQVLERGKAAYARARSAVTGPEGQQVLERGKSAYARARSAIVIRRKAKPPAAEASPPPA